MKHVFKVFFGAEGTWPFLVLFSLLLGAAAEAIGVSALLPALTAIAGQTGNASALNKAILDFVGSFGINPSFGNLVLIVAIALVIKSVIAFCVMSYAGIAAARVSIRLRQRLIAAIFDANWQFYSQQHSGRFANTVSNDATRAGDAYRLAAQFISTLVLAVLYGLVAIFLNWQLALAGLAIGGVIALGVNKLIWISKRAGYKQTDRTSELTVFVVDMLANIKALKTMHRYEPMQTALGRTLKRLRRTLITGELAKNGVTHGNDAITVILAAVGVYTAHILWSIPLAELIVSGVLLLKIADFMAKLQKSIQQSVQLESAYLRTTELIALAESQRETHAGKAQFTLKTGCRFSKVNFAHGSTQILRDVDLDIPARGITVLKGSSGAGKTTIIDLLVGLHTPSHGDIIIDGVSLEEIDIIRWRRKIGYVPQELNLLHANIRENISLGDDTITDEAILQALKLAGAEGFIESLASGLDTDVGEMGGKLSGGQRQRISLARALVTSPDLLILDEVTSALDPETEREIVENIAALGGNFTIVAITHRSAWTTIADRLYEVARGKVTPVKTSPRPRSGKTVRRT